MKRLFDFSVSVVLTIALAPLILLIAVLVKVKLGSPVIFCQTRAGLHGKPFKLFKFRTMAIRYNADGTYVSDSERMTSFGSILRSFSLDELPELFNILRGDMSLVGPRPLLIEYVPLYTDYQMRRHDVPPGLTGWAQINGRNNLSWTEKFDLDIWYINNKSLTLDIKILWITIIKLFRREGISADNHVSMPRFTGAVEDESR